MILLFEAQGDREASLSRGKGTHRQPGKHCRRGLRASEVLWKRVLIRSRAVHCGTRVDNRMGVSASEREWRFLRGETSEGRSLGTVAV